MKGQKCLFQLEKIKNSRLFERYPSQDNHQVSQSSFFYQPCLLCYRMRIFMSVIYVMALFDESNQMAVQCTWMGTEQHPLLKAQVDVAVDTSTFGMEKNITICLKGQFLLLALVFFLLWLGSRRVLKTRCPQRILWRNMHKV